MNLIDSLDQSKRSIGVNNQLHPTGTLSTTLHNPMGEANPYVRFLYVPQKKFNHIPVQLLGSMNSYLINMNKQVNNQQL